MSTQVDQGAATLFFFVHKDSPDGHAAPAGRKPFAQVDVAQLAGRSTILDELAVGAEAVLVADGQLLA